MAGPIAHIVCALSILQSGALDVSDHKAFIVGTSFPDIRYYCPEVKREQTHIADITWEQVKQEKDSFKAGLLLHSLVDRIREEYLQANNGYSSIPSVPFRSQLMKVSEDMAIYNMVEHWPRIVQYFDTLYGPEYLYNIPEQELKNWHTILQEYCKRPPDMNNIVQLFSSTVFKSKIGRIGQRIAPTLALYPRFVTYLFNNNQQFINLMNYFYANAAHFLTGKMPLKQSAHTLSTLKTQREAPITHLMSQ